MLQMLNTAKHHDALPLCSTPTKRFAGLIGRVDIRIESRLPLSLLAGCILRRSCRVIVFTSVVRSHESLRDPSTSHLAATESGRLLRILAQRHTPSGQHRDPPLAMNLADIKKRYETDGFVIVPGLIPDSKESDLKAATERVIDKTREGAWTHRRTVGSQFPPYKDSDDAWGVQHVMHPDLHEPIFLEWYSSPEICAVAQELLQCNSTDLQMGLFFS